MFKRFIASMRTGYSNSKKEISQTKEATKLLWAARKRKLSAEEKGMVINQSGDVMRLMFLSALFLVPFGSVLVIVFVKGGDKIGVRFLPSSFIKEK